MSDITDTKQCSNCKLEIPSGNFTIHSVHCQRNFYLCSKCDQPVNYSSRVDHDEANHTVVHCKNCNLELEKYLLDDHLINDCPDREVRCQICDIDVKASDVAEHENYCGSRTEKCPECEEFVMLKYKSLHIDSNHTFIKLSDANDQKVKKIKMLGSHFCSEQGDAYMIQGFHFRYSRGIMSAVCCFKRNHQKPGPSPSWQYGKRTLCNFLPDLSSKTSTNVAIRKRKSRENLRKTRSSGSSESKEDSDEISRKNFDSPPIRKDSCTGSKIGNEFENKEVKKSTKDLDEWPALSSLRSLQISEEKDDKSIGKAAGNSNQNEVDEDSDLFYAIQVSHELNSDIWRKEVSTEDNTLKNRFRPLTDKEFTEKFMKKDMFEKGAKKVDQEQNVDIFMNDSNHSYDEQETVKLPCEFCGNLIASNFLILHQTRCILYMTEAYTGRSERNKQLQFDDDLEQKIACVNCNRFFRLSHFENHQLHCQRNSMKSLKNQEKVSDSKKPKAVNVKPKEGVLNGFRTGSSPLTTVGSAPRFSLSKNKEEEIRRVRSTTVGCGSGFRTNSSLLTTVDGASGLELLKNNEEDRSVRNNLNCPDSGVITKTTKVSRKNRRAPSPPRR